ncbi:hypothetical protein DERP_013468, partial [Dermatophagoides pteronyssinus]
VKCWKGSIVSCSSKVQLSNQSMNDMCIPQQKKEILLNESMDKSTEMKQIPQKMLLSSEINQYFSKRKTKTKNQ